MVYQWYTNCIPMSMVYQLYTNDMRCCSRVRLGYLGGLCVARRQLSPLLQLRYVLSPDSRGELSLLTQQDWLGCFERLWAPVAFEQRNVMIREKVLDNMHGVWAEVPDHVPERQNGKWVPPLDWGPFGWMVLLRSIVRLCCFPRGNSFLVGPCCMRGHNLWRPIGGVGPRRVIIC